MKTPDVNILVHAINADTPQHTAARRWLEDAYLEPAGIGFTWVALRGFVRITTRRGILPTPLSIEDAFGLVDDWLNHPHARILNPTDRHAALLARLLLGAGRGGSLVTDVHLAAIAIEHGATLGSFDHDFARFAGLQLEQLSTHMVHDQKHA